MQQHDERKRRHHGHGHAEIAVASEAEVPEILGERLLTLHNIHFFMRFMEQMRAALDEGSFPAFRARAWRDLRGVDAPAP